MCLATRSQEGEPQRFLDNVALRYAGEECLLWPFAKSGFGYGQIRKDGRAENVHRIICEAVHGPAPSPDHEVAHTCGKGNLGCVNPSHLEWKTHVANVADTLLHGTRNRGERNGQTKLTEEEVLQIFALKGVLSQSAIAVMFGITRANVA